MKITNSQKVARPDGLFILVPKKGITAKTFGKTLPDDLKKEVQLRMKDKDFLGESGEILQVFTKSRLAKKIFLVGIGDNKKPEEITKSASVVFAKAKKAELVNVALLLPTDIDYKKVILGFVLGGYKFKITNEKKDNSIKTVEIITVEKIDETEFKSELSLAQATNYTRDLVNLPPNMMTPDILADEAMKLGKGVRNPVKVKVYGEKEMKKMKMGALLGVGQGSHEESKLIVIEYYGGEKNEAPIVFAGKAVCFDAGGYNLKPTNYIEDMKSDMAGGATILGLFKWIAENKPKKNVVAVLGAVENLVSGQAFKPGDIITAMNGKTIEIGNTDAEGRLVLADCLCFANEKFKPAQIIDVATLTGAVIVALGNQITGIMGNNKKLISQMQKAADKADEKVWELPLGETFTENMKGTISDLNNVSSGKSGAGSSNGGAFLQNFVGKTPWLHMDLGGTAFGGKYGINASVKGATGAMVRTLKSFIAD